MAPVSAAHHLTNPLAPVDQILRLTKNAGEDQQSKYFAQFQLINASGVLLRLPHEVTAQALVLLQRFILSSGPDHDEGQSPKTYCAAAVYLGAKLSATPVSPRSVVNVFAYLTSKASPLKCVNSKGAVVSAVGRDYYVSEGNYERERQKLFICESMILAAIGFDTRIVLPHALALTYLQVLGASSGSLIRKTLDYLNAGLLSPQFLFLTHQPNALAAGAIYLAAKETGVKLVEQNWWEVFDVDREDLGFLVLSLGSMPNFAKTVTQQWEATAGPTLS